MLSVGRRARSLASGLATLAVAGLSVWVPSAGAATVPTTAATGATGAATQQAVARAFRALDPLPPVSRGRALLQGYDGAMRLALQTAGTRLLDGTNGRPVTVSNATGTASVVRPGEATVPLTISVKTKSPPPSFSLEYTAVALEEQGRWQVSWTTMCMLVEAADQLCPPTPAHVDPGDVLPSPEATALDSAAGPSTGLVNPGSLAIASDGGVLIADRGRNQILEWKAGVVTVVAGNGLQGYSGDGGAAVEAELNDPEEIAVSRSGTIYFTDSGNHRIRAIEPDGRMETVAGDGSLGLSNTVDGGPATAAALNPYGLAVSPTGLLYIASNSAILVVRPDGLISTLVQGGPPAGVDVEAGGTPTAFFPESIALNGQGDLIAFSFSPKELFSVSPAGQVTELAPDYATALSTAPDGTVLVGQHGEGIERVSGSSVAPLPADLSVAGLPHPIVADGVAEAPNGVTYVDTALDGFNDHVGLYEITNGSTEAVPVTSSLSSTLPPAGAPGFPEAMFPPAAAPAISDAALSSCPSMQGVTPFTPAATAVASQLLGLWNTNFSYDLHASDRSWWPGVVETFTGSGLEGRQTVGQALPASGSLYSPAIAAACGSSLVKDSLDVLMGPSAYDFSYQHVYLLDRDGTPLVYFAIA